MVTVSDNPYDINFLRGRPGARPLDRSQLMAVRESIARKSYARWAEEGFTSPQMLLPYVDDMGRVAIISEENLTVVIYANKPDDGIRDRWAVLLFDPMSWTDADEDTVRAYLFTQYRRVQVGDYLDVWEWVMAMSSSGQPPLVETLRWFGAHIGAQPKGERLLAGLLHLPQTWEIAARELKKSAYPMVSGVAQKVNSVFPGIPAERQKNITGWTMLGIERELSTWSEQEIAQMGVEALVEMLDEFIDAFLQSMQKLDHTGQVKPHLHRDSGYFTR